MGFKLDAMDRPKIWIEIIGKSAFYELEKKDEKIKSRCPTWPLVKFLSSGIATPSAN